ncbi:hypothetical protein ABK040_009378 [Willaertia magna]
MTEKEEVENTNFTNQSKTVINVPNFVEDEELKQQQIKCEITTIKHNILQSEYFKSFCKLYKPFIHEIDYNNSKVILVSTMKNSSFMSIVLGLIILIFLFPLFPVACFFIWIGLLSHRTLIEINFDKKIISLYESKILSNHFKVHTFDIRFEEIDQFEMKENMYLYNIPALSVNCKTTPNHHYIDLHLGIPEQEQYEEIAKERANIFTLLIKESLNNNNQSLDNILP